MIRALAILSATLIVGHAAPAQAQSPDATLDEAEQKLLTTAHDAQRAGRHEAAIEALETLARTHPDLAILSRLLTHSYFETNRTTDARAAAVRCLELGRPTPDVLNLLVRIDEERDDLTALLEVVPRLILIEPSHLEWRLLHADLLVATGLPAAAESALRHARRLAPTRADIWIRLGNLQLELANPSAAAVTLETGWHLGAREPRIAETLSALAQRANDPDTAAHWQRVAVDSAPTASDFLPRDPARLRLAQLLDLADQPEPARQLAQDLTASTDSDVAADAHQLLATWALRGDTTDPAIETAISHLERANTVRPLDPSTRTILGRAHYRLGQLEPAIALLTPAIESDSVDRTTVAILARAHITRAEFEAVQPVIVRYVELFGLDATATRLIEECAAIGTER